MIGYKAFYNDMTCRNFQYSIGQTYKINERPQVCSQGFHFCKRLEDVFDYYPFDRHTKVCKIEALGDIDTLDCIKFCTNNIKIEEEIDFNYLFQLRYKKGAISNNIDLSTVEIGTKIYIKNHILICVNIQDYAYVFAFDESMAQLPVYKIYSLIHNLENFKDWLPPEWLDSIEEIFIPNEYEVYGSYEWGRPDDSLLLPFAYYADQKNRIKYVEGYPIPWWLSSVCPSSYFATSVYSSFTAATVYMTTTCIENINSYDRGAACASTDLGVAPHFIIRKTR